VLVRKEYAIRAHRAHQSPRIVDHINMLSTNDAHHRFPVDCLGPGDVLRLDADLACDAVHPPIAPASILLEVEPDGGLVILAADTPNAIQTHPSVRGARRINLLGSAILPGLVNAHTHLDLTGIGPQAHDPSRGFVPWIDMVRKLRPTHERDIEDAVRRGIDLSIRGGTVAVGDIAGAPGGEISLVPLRVLLDSGLAGHSFLEFFALGDAEGWAHAVVSAINEALRLTRGKSGSVRPGLQPHAPYSVSPRGYIRAQQIAGELGCGVCTHLGESVEERELIADGTGPMRAFLERLGLWTDRVGGLFGHGRTPTRHLREVLDMRPLSAVHVNDASDEDIALLARTRTSVVYCPRAHAYFGAHARLGPHRYLDMLSAGVNVALGTDSIINLPADVCAGCGGSGGGGISVLDEMRVLWRRDGGEPRELLAMGTTRGARALGMDPACFTLSAGSRPLGLLAVKREPPERMGETAAMRDILDSDAAPSVLFYGNTCGFTGI